MNMTIRSFLKAIIGGFRACCPRGRLDKQRIRWELSRLQDDGWMENLEKVSVLGKLLIEQKSLLTPVPGAINSLELFYALGVIGISPDQFSCYPIQLGSLETGIHLPIQVSDRVFKSLVNSQAFMQLKPAIMGNEISLMAGYICTTISCSPVSIFLELAMTSLKKLKPRFRIQLWEFKPVRLIKNCPPDEMNLFLGMVIDKRSHSMTRTYEPGIEGLLLAYAFDEPGQEDRLNTYVTTMESQHTGLYHKYIPSTWGVLMWEEQVFQILADLLDIESNLMVRHFVKADQQQDVVWESQKSHFFQSCQEKGFSKDKAEELYLGLQKNARNAVPLLTILPIVWNCYYQAFFKSTFPQIFEECHAEAKKRFKSFLNEFASY